MAQSGMMGDLDRDEVSRRLPEIDDIRDEGLREQVLLTMQEAPDYFWTAPASHSHHPPQHRARHGLWLHVKRTVTAFERIAPSMVKQGFMQWHDVDLGRAACIVHGMFKFGMPTTSTDDIEDEYEDLVADWLLEHTSMDKRVVGCVRSHAGPYYSSAKPSTHLEQMVHIADMIASGEDFRIAVKEPHERLRESFPDLREREGYDG